MTVDGMKVTGSWREVADAAREAAGKPFKVLGLEWRAVPGYNRYVVSENGDVMSLNFRRTGEPKILKPIIRGSGYYYVDLFKENVRHKKTVHHVVASAFIGERPKGYTVNHKDENKLNNHYTNLEYMTGDDNYHYGTAIERMRATQQRTHPTRKAVICIYNDGITEYSSISEASRATGFETSGIVRCCKGEHSSCGGMIWKYKKVS